MAGKRANTAQVARTRSRSRSQEAIAATPPSVHTKKKNSRCSANIQRMGGWVKIPQEGTIIGQVWTRLARWGKLRV